MEKLKEGLQLLEDIGVLEDPSDTTEIRELRIKTIETVRFTFKFVSGMHSVY